MKERPILFSALMVRALLDGSKTQTRRVCKPAETAALTRVIPAFKSEDGEQRPPYVTPGWFGDEEGDILFCNPYGVTGDRLWVRETHSPYLIGCENDIRNYVRVKYKADESIQEIDISREIYDYLDKKDMRREWVPSIHMFRWASRINLEITNVRVERLQDISEADALAEGICCQNVIIGCNCYNGHHTEENADRYFFDDCNEAGYEFAIDAYAGLWESINGPGSWDLNPWVWVIEFRKMAA